MCRPATDSSQMISRVYCWKNACMSLFILSFYHVLRYAVHIGQVLLNLFRNHDFKAKLKAQQEDIFIGCTESQCSVKVGRGSNFVRANTELYKNSGYIGTELFLSVSDGSGAERMDRCWHHDLIFME